MNDEACTQMAIDSWHNRNWEIRKLANEIIDFKQICEQVGIKEIVEN